MTAPDREPDEHVGAPQRLVGAAALVAGSSTPRSSSFIAFMAVRPTVDRALSVAANQVRAPRREELRHRHSGGAAPVDHDLHVLEALADHVQGVVSAASTTTAVPCWSSWNTGMSSLAAAVLDIEAAR